MFQAIYPYVIVFLTGMLGIWKAIPVGFAFQLHPLLVWVLTSGGAGAAAFIIYFFGNQIRDFIASRRKKKNNKKKTRAMDLFEKYGTAGLGFLGCLLMGPNMTLLVGLLIVKSPKRLLLWTLAGIVVWTFGLSMLAEFGIDLFQKFV